MSKPPLLQSSKEWSPTTLAHKYFLDDLPGATLPGGFIRKILDCLESSKPISYIQVAALQKRGFSALFCLVQKELSFEKYQQFAEIEKAQRLEKKGKEIEEKIREKAAVKAAANRLVSLRATKKRAYDKDPRNIAKARNKELRRAYAIDWFVDEKDFPRLMALLHKLEKGKRLTDKEVVWLKAGDDEGFGEGYFTEVVSMRYHKTEAGYFEKEYLKTKNPWSAINASSHYRKSKLAKNADKLLSTIKPSKLRGKKVKSAYYTTYGGAKRDLSERKDALSFGETAHQLTPENFRPCTLLGAVNMELGNYSLGHSWYEKASQLGASDESIDSDIKQIFGRLNRKMKGEMRCYLLGRDSFRFSWIRDLR